MAFTTRKSLIERIREQDGIAWEEFYETYAPLIRLHGDDWGIKQPQEVEDLVQNVMFCFFEKCDKFNYDPTKGRFRDYMRTIIRNQACQIHRKRKSEKAQLSSEKEREFKPQEEDNSNLEELWDEEWRSFLYLQAIEKLRNQVDEKTFQIFQLYALRGLPCRRVAAFMEVSESSVYAAKSRCLEHLRRIIKELED